MNASNDLQFQSMLPEDILIIVPTTYAKLNLLNTCQALLAFKRAKLGHLGELHVSVLDAKKSIVKQVISRIVATDSLINKTDQSN